MLPLEIAPAAVKEMLDAGDDIRLIDCREVHEYALSSIEGAELMPMNTIPSRLTAIDAMAERITRWWWSTATTVSGA
ncbi:MAG: rhodanese-like domain-containing protein [Acidobacteria bacterium]|nr:rhodanese-like domain-containing protein [Acidobacteriota bacterium]